jgi:hypothetical protein
VEEPTVFVALVHPFARKRDLIDASRRITDMNAGHCVKSEKGH